MNVKPLALPVSPSDNKVTDALNKLASRPSPQKAAEQRAETKRMQQAVADFEALFLRQVFQSMRETVGDVDLFGKGPGEKIFREMLDEQYAEIASKKHGGLGMQESLLRQMTGGRVSLSD